MTDLKATSTFDYLKNQKLDPAKTALFESWEHWRRMICTVEAERDRGTLALTDTVDQTWMKDRLDGEFWGSEHCALCQMFWRDTRIDIEPGEYEDCRGCPVGEKFGRCVDPWDTVENTYSKVERADLWGDWLEHANKLVEQIASLMVAP